MLRFQWVVRILQDAFEIIPKPAPARANLPGSCLALTERPTDGGRYRWADARTTVDRQNAIEVPERDASNHRLAPHESRLDWLQANPAPFAQGQEREDPLDWLQERAGEHSRNDGPERERYR